MTYATTLLNTPSNDLHHPVAPVLQQSLIAALEGDVEALDAASFLAELAKRQSSAATADVPSDIVDLIWIMDIESETIGQKRQEKLRELTVAIIVRTYCFFSCFPWVSRQGVCECMLNIFTSPSLILVFTHIGKELYPRLHHEGTMGDCFSGTGRTHLQLKTVHHSRCLHQHSTIVSRPSVSLQIFEPAPSPFQDDN